MLGHRVTWSVKEAEAKMVPKVSGPQIHTLSRRVLLASISLKQDPLSTHLVSSLSSNPFCFLKSFIILTFILWHVWLKRNQKNLEPISFSPSSASCSISLLLKARHLISMPDTMLLWKQGRESFDGWGKKIPKQCRVALWQGAAAPPEVFGGLPTKVSGPGPLRKLPPWTWSAPCFPPVGFPSCVSPLLRDKCLWNRALCHQFLRCGYFPSFMCFLPLYIYIYIYIYNLLLLFFGDTVYWVLFSSIMKQHLLVSLFVSLAIADTQYRDSVFHWGSKLWYSIIASSFVHCNNSLKRNHDPPAYWWCNGTAHVER